MKHNGRFRDCNLRNLRLLVLCTDVPTSQCSGATERSTSGGPEASCALWSKETIVECFVLVLFGVDVTNSSIHDRKGDIVDTLEHEISVHFTDVPLGH